MVTPGMIKVNLRTPPEPASKSNDTADDPVSATTSTVPTNDEDNPYLPIQPNLCSERLKSRKFSLILVLHSVYRHALGFRNIFQKIVGV